MDALIDYRGKSPTKSDSGIPVLSAKVVKTTGLLRPIEQTIAPDYYPKWMTRGYPKPGDVVMTTEAPLGEVIQLDAETASFALGQRIVCLRGKPGKLDNTFLRYLLTSPTQQEVLASRATGTTVLGISQKALRSMPVSFPPISEQREIGALLSSLDDKIELNRKMNATLEAMARALFRDWFVDFGPTRAKMAGAEPYLSPDLWPLFPDRLDAEGKPEGWEVFSLGQIADHHTRTLSPSESPGALFEHFSLPAFDRDQNPALDHGATIKSNKTLVPPGAILLSKLNPEIPRVWLPEMPNGRQQIASTEFLAYTGKDGALRGLLFCLFSDDDIRKMLQAMVTGTSKSHQRISPPDLLRREVISGTAELFRRFDGSVMPLLNRVLANRTESRTLAQTRDLLLPKLMSGEVRVRQAEQLVGEAT
ncbi:restriction endonuclease subunit S [Cereibacter sphaeroides]|uniref:restriction endonuclease subunit S n=1 Tax=Cereibacter sphaeroides TaxID=1063 RepID=UPI0015593EF9|nr:restriction endonuclease subunit S [Cereibacter sphaeroides]